MEKGYIKLYRAIDDNELLANDNTCYVVFGKLLTHADRFTGTYTTGRFKLATLCNLKPTTLYAALKRLESSTMIRQVSDNRKTTIYICNWSKYQQDDDKSMTSRRRANDTKQEREKEEYIDKSIYKAKTPSNDIDEMFEFWEQTIGTPIIGQKQKNRYACSNLLKSQGKDRLKQLIGGVKLAQETAYAPKIADFTELQSKLNKLLTWGNAMKSDLNKQKLKGVTIG